MNKDKLQKIQQLIVELLEEPKKEPFVISLTTLREARHTAQGKAIEPFSDGYYRVLVNESDEIVGAGIILKAKHPVYTDQIAAGCRLVFLPPGAPRLILGVGYWAPL